MTSGHPKGEDKKNEKIINKHPTHPPTKLISNHQQLRQGKKKKHRELNKIHIFILIDSQGIS